MKQLSIFMGTCIIFYTTACSNSSNIATRLTTNQNSSHISIIDGGNPEVYNKKINLCFSLKRSAKEECLEQIYKGIDIVVIQDENRPIVLAGRGEPKDKKIKLTKEDRRVVIYLDTTNVKKPIRVNIKEFKKSETHTKLILDISKEDIKDSIILKDRDGKLLLKYEIIKL